MIANQGDIAVTTARGHSAVFLTRTDTNDAALIAGIIGNDEYLLGQIPAPSGWAIDIGAHIGAVAISLAIDYPELRVKAVEPVPDNAVVLLANAIHNKVDERVEVITAAAAEPGRKRVQVAWNYRSAGQKADQPYVNDSRYIANIFNPADPEVDVDRHMVKAVSLDDLMDGIDRVSLLKIDCEGCEWNFLRSPRVADVDLIVGEYHNGGGLESLRHLIGATHRIDQTGGQHDIGTFRAVRQ